MKTPIQEASLRGRIWYKGTDREILGKALCDVGGKSNVGVGLLELAPACNTLPSHYHTHEEEHLFVLSGVAILHLGSETFELTEGSYVHFPAQQEIFHHLENISVEPFRYIMIGERNSADSVIYKKDA
jgi:uncharacterized cupin superfamily protein|tara:strand:- start:1988 stop:2371 length:384 start_codon:yes stop_codon:yes gene_type:complete